MKKYIAVCFLFIAIKFFPQQITDPQQTPPPNNQQQNISPYNNVNIRNGIKAEKYKNLKIGGLVLATAGGIGLIGGIALVSSGVSNQISTNSNQTSTTTTTYGTSTSQTTQNITPANTSKIVGGVYLGVFSAFAIGGGTVMAIIGSHKEKKYNAASRLSVMVAPTAFRITYKF